MAFDAFDASSALYCQGSTEDWLQGHVHLPVYCLPVLLLPPPLLLQLLYIGRPKIRWGYICQEGVHRHQGKECQRW